MEEEGEGEVRRSRGNMEEDAVRKKEVEHVEYRKEEQVEGEDGKWKQARSRNYCTSGAIRSC